MKANRTNDADDLESIEPRTERALTEYLTVTPDAGRAAGADDMVLVSSGSGSAYLVDLRAGRCECPDHRHREARCKHLRRAAIATGERAIPAEVLADLEGDVDPHLGAHTDATPRIAAADGGIIEAGDEGEILDDTADTDDERPEECRCTPGSGLACWPCYRDGFETPAGEGDA